MSLLLGQQTPRLELAPECVSNAAEDAIALYEEAGQRLDLWQERCLWVGLGERADGLWAAFEVGIICQRQNGKGAPIEALCLASAFIWGNKVTIYSAHRGDTAQAMCQRVKSLVKDTPDLARRCKPIADSAEVIELLNGNVIAFRTRTRSGGRGLTGDLVILDEALELNSDQIQALVPVLLARPHAQLWYVSTVPTHGDQHLCGVRARVLEKDERLAWIEWGADKGAALDDPVALAQANPALGIRITLERLRDMRGILGDAAYSTECMGIWPDLAVGAVLDHVVWRTSMLDAGSRRAEGGDVVLALDMTPSRDHGSIGMYAVRSDGLEHMQLVDYRADPAGWMVARVGELDRVLRPVLWVVDRRNGAFALAGALAHVHCCGPVRKEECAKPVGVALAPDPRKALRRGELLALDSADMHDAVGQFIDGFRAKRFRHPGQEQFDRAVRNARARTVGDSGQLVWTRRASETDIGPVVVATGAKFGLHAWLTRRVVEAPRSRIW